MNILVSAISFVNNKKPGSEIYTTFASRLIDNTLNKTPFDIMISTNSGSSFANFHDNPRVIIRHIDLDKHKVHVKFFNQMLKFYALRDIDTKYDWVLYLDCDAGFTDQVNIQEIESYLQSNIESDMFAVRTDATLIGEESICLEYDRGDKTNTRQPLFYEKFQFYNIMPQWRGACLPSEHILLLKNNNKLQIMSYEFEKFCTQFESQDNPDNIIAADMEAFEIGVSAHIAGYKVKDLGSWGHHDLLKVGFNFNNFERVKY